MRDDLFGAEFSADTLKGYETLRCFAKTGLCETLLLRDEDEELFVAKLYKKGAVNTAEGKILSRLSHSGVPKYAGSIETENETIVLREYIYGIPLDEYLQTNRPSQKQILRILLGLCDILSYLHGCTPPVIHRDVKLSNIIMREDAPVLIDFGISRIYNEQASNDTQIALTHDVAAPEQYGFAQTDARTDIYAFGILLRTLCDGGFLENNCKLNTIIKKCTRLDPNDRYSNMERIKRALNSALNKRKRFFLAAVAVLEAVVILFLSLALWRALTPMSTHLLGPNDLMVFTEPLIEAAARIQLGKNETDPIYVYELGELIGIYVVADKPCADYEEYYAEFYRDFRGSGQKDRGEITSLDDLQYMPYLRDVAIAAQAELCDISPLSKLKRLYNIDLRFNDKLHDVTPLAGHDDIEILYLTGTDITSINSLLTLTKLEYLGIDFTRVDSLEGIEVLTKLRFLHVGHTFIGDLTPVKKLPSLERVYISAGSGYMDDMTGLVESFDNVPFEIMLE